MELDASTYSSASEYDSDTRSAAFRVVYRSIMYFYDASVGLSGNDSSKHKGERRDGQRARERDDGGCTLLTTKARVFKTRGLPPRLS
jgi:hypothetical protein